MRSSVTTLSSCSIAWLSDTPGFRLNDRVTDGNCPWWVTVNGLTPLSSVATVDRGVSPLTVTHQGQLPAVTLSCNLKPGVSLSQAIEQLDKVATGLRIPPTVIGSFHGAA